MACLDPNTISSHFSSWGADLGPNTISLAPDAVPRHMSDRLPERLPDAMSEHTSEYARKIGRYNVRIHVRQNAK